MKALMNLREAAEETPYGVDVLRVAVLQPKGCFWPRLRAKQGSRGEYLVTAAALEEWAESLPDA